MRSRITIDVDYDNQPVIKIEYQHSDDVRDRLVKKFMESFGSQSYLATFFYDNSVTDPGPNRQAIVRPLHTRDYKWHKDFFDEMANKEENVPKPKQIDEQESKV